DVSLQAVLLARRGIAGQRARYRCRGPRHLVNEDQQQRFPAGLLHEVGFLPLPIVEDADDLEAGQLLADLRAGKDLVLVIGSGRPADQARSASKGEQRSSHECVSSGRWQTIIGPREGCPIQPRRSGGVASVVISLSELRRRRSTRSAS